MFTGPCIIFDKSALQGLSADESMWLECFYMSNLTPLFYVETLADLEKEVKEGRTPEQIVGSIAHKTPSSPTINVHHRDLIAGELIHGTEIETTMGRPIISGGKTVSLAGETGVIFQESEEAQAFSRWQDGNFLAVERNHAREWRNELKLMEGENYDSLKKIFTVFGIPKSFEELKEMTSALLLTPDQRSLLKMGMGLMGLTDESQDLVLNRWDNVKATSVSEFAPYFNFVLSIDLFFYLGSASGLFTTFRHPQTHKIDIAYLYYLPFCQIFTSSDKIHIHVAPLFLREDQTFISGEDLKKDFSKLDTHYSSLPDEVKARGVVAFAPCPPDDISFVTTQMWDKYMAKTWRQIKDAARKFDGTDDLKKFNPEIEKEMIKKIKDFHDKATPVESNLTYKSDNMDSMIIKRNIMARKGKWNKFPPEILKSKPILD